MSVESTANSARIRRTTGFNPGNPKTTIMCWFRTNAFGEFRIVWDHGSSTSPLLLGISADVDPSDLYFFNGDVDLITVPASVSPATWYFTALVLDTTTTVKLYFAPVGGTLSVTASADPFVGFLGTELILYNELSFDEHLNGQIAAMKIYSGTNGALAQAQIENEFRRIGPATTRDLYALPLLYNAPSAGADYSGNDRAFTVEGAPATAHAMPPILPQGMSSYVCD